MERKEKQEQYKAINDWKRKNVKRTCFELRNDADAELIAWLDQQPKKNEYIRSLIRQDIERRSEKK